MKKDSQQKQNGFALLESLIAILVLALGVLGIIGMQLRTLTNTQNSLYRGQAIRLIEDLSERLISNPNSLAHGSEYISDWSATPQYGQDCSNSPCTAQELAQFDIWNWKNSVTNILPNGKSSVFFAPDEQDPDSRRQLGVMIAWRANESSPSELLNNYTGSGESCPADMTCHFQYIPLYARCLPLEATTPQSKLHCPAK